MKAIALVVALAVGTGCFGYNHSAKKWAYVGDVLLIAGGGAAIAADIETRPPSCSGPTCVYQASLGGGTVVGAVLVAAGLVGIIYNVTRTEVKTSR